MTDDGVGIEAGSTSGHGLANLTRRAELLGGTLALTTVPSGGCEFRWSVPLVVTPDAARCAET